MVLITSKSKSAKLLRTAFEVNESESKEKKLRKAVAALQRKARREKVKESLLNRVQQKPKEAESHSKVKVIFPATRWNALHSKSVELLKQHMNTSDYFESSDSSSNVNKKIMIRNVKPHSRIHSNKNKKRIKCHVIISSPKDLTVGRHESPVPTTTTVFESHVSSTSAQLLKEMEQDGNNDEMDDIELSLDPNVSVEHELSENDDSSIPSQILKELGEINLSIEDLNPIEFPIEDRSSPTTSQITRIKQEEADSNETVKSQLYPEATNENEKIEDFSSISNSSSLLKRDNSDTSVDETSESTGLELYERTNSYKCSPCNNKWFASSIDFIQHSKDIHSISFYSVVDPDLPPPKFTNEKYVCLRCEVVQFTEKKNYARHAKKYHSLVIRKDEEEPYNDPHNHCTACCPVYQAQRQIKIANHHISCEATYRETANYHLHLYKEHGIMNPINPGKSKPNTSIKPDEYDPNFYCCSCEKKFQTQKSYRAHLRKAHKIYQSMPYQR